MIIRNLKKRVTKAGNFSVTCDPVQHSVSRHEIGIVLVYDWLPDSCLLKRKFTAVLSALQLHGTTHLQHLRIV